MKNNNVKIAIADDHVLFRKGIAELVNDFDGYSLELEANNGEELLKRLEPNDQLPAIVILDINMPVLDGYDTCKKLKEKYPDIKVLALSMYDDEVSIIKMLKAGANGYILKDAHPMELKTALNQIVEKGQYYSEFISSIMMSSIREGSEDKTELLNDREIEFLKLASTELTYKAIADEMSLSPRTIDGYRESLFEKLQAKSRVGLVLFAIKSGIVKV